MYRESEFISCNDCLSDVSVGDVVSFTDTRDFSTNEGTVSIYNHGWVKQKVVSYRKENFIGINEGFDIFPDHIRNLNKI